MRGASGATVALAFRFHVNLYHSYRGDSLDEQGIGKDLRIIRGILADLSRLEREGIPVRGTWDIENYYSLERYLPRHAPDIIDGIRSAVAAGRDEVELMSYNNGLISAHTEEEAERAISWAISNPSHSGLADVFGTWAPIVRPQECMFTPHDIDLYRTCGVKALSLYYSAVPFNGFGNFVPPLSMDERYNPLTLRCSPGGPSLLLLPAYNHGDILEHGFSLRSWIKELRRHQEGQDQCEDLLLLLDMDADDYFWEGMKLPLGNRLFPSFAGLYSLVHSVSDLPYLRFARPWDYLCSHRPAAEVRFGQDCADGSWDGYSSWAEKRENGEVWSIIDASRRLATAAARLSGIAEMDGGECPVLLDAATTARVRALSTTHFGMASPVMNVDRLKDAFSRAEEAKTLADAALRCSMKWGRGGADPTGTSSVDEEGPRRPLRILDPEIDRLPTGRGSLVILEADDDGEGLAGAFTFGEKEPFRGLVNPGHSVWTAAADGPDGEPAVAAESAEPPQLTAGSNGLSNAFLSLDVDGGGVGSIRHPSGFSARLASPRIRYGGRDLPVTVDSEGHSDTGNGWASLIVTGRILFPDGEQATWHRRFTLLAASPYLYVDLQVDYPTTTGKDFAAGKAQRLGRTWDGRWMEVAPLEIEPGLASTAANPASVWKHNFRDRVSSYALDYHRFGPNRCLSSVNNHITDGWVAVGDGSRGLLLAQSSSRMSSFAFCPLRSCLAGSRQKVLLNPFGTYWGPQLRAPTATMGLGRRVSVLMGNQYDSYAPSWAGGSLNVSLMIASYEGNEPPGGLQRDACLYAWTPVRVDRRP